MTFAKKGNRVEMTFGANTFSEGEGSDYEAIETLLGRLSEFPQVKLFLYNQPDRTFHPKLYLFSAQKKALLIIGSSNWSQGGLIRNIEVNVLIELDLSNEEQAQAHREVIKMFEDYWKELP